MTIAHKIKIAVLLLRFIDYNPKIVFIYNPMFNRRSPFEIQKVCPECGSKLKVAKYSGEYMSSLVDCDGAIEDLTGKSVLEYF